MGLDVILSIILNLSVIQQRVIASKSLLQLNLYLIEILHVNLALIN